MMRLKSIAVVLSPLSVQQALRPAQETRRSRQQGKSIRFFFMPLKGETGVQPERPVIQKFLEDTTGLSFKMIPAEGLRDDHEGLRNRQADIAFMNTLGFLMARDWTKAEGSPPAALRRRPTGRIAARSSRAQTVRSRPGRPRRKTIAFSDPSRPGGYLYALKFLRDHTSKPAKSLFAKPSGCGADGL